VREDEQAWLDDLNPQQRAAATHGDGPLLVVAGAGSGKTKTLAYRVSYLVSRGVAPDRILLLTFTRRAAAEMLKRAAAVTGTASATSMHRVWGGTFHAIASRLLRLYAQPAGLSPEFTIIDRSDAEDLIDVIRNDMSLSQQGSRFPRKSTCLSIYSRRVNGNEPLERVVQREYPWCAVWQEELTALFREYVERKERHHVLDYDDLLLYLYYLLEDEALAESVGERFDHVLVDEYQDTNPIQAGILAGLRRRNPNITVVGDDAQSIYGFRSATVRNMLDFPAQFPGARVVTLEQNYRSVPPVLETTNRLIAQARERYSKNLWSTRTGGQRPQLITCFDESSQDEAVIGRVLEHYEQGIALNRQAVLFRAAAHSTSLELALSRKNIPFRKYGGLRFLEAAHVKDIVALLRILDNPRDEIAWFRVLQLLNGVGPATAAAAVAHVAAHGHDAAAIADFEGPAASRDGIHELGALMGELTTLAAEAPGVHIERIRRFYEPILLRTYENAEARVHDVEHLGELAAGYLTRSEFLTDLVLDPPISTGAQAGPPHKDEDWLVLSTIHSAKGLEWDAVYLIHAADGCLPSDMATGSESEIDEELRLTYVAMTRARDFLYVSWPLRYYVGPGAALTDKHTYAQCCRFFSPAVVTTMETREHGVSGAARFDPVTGSISRKISSRIREMWR